MRSPPGHRAMHSTSLGMALTVGILSCTIADGAFQEDYIICLYRRQTPVQEPLESSVRRPVSTGLEPLFLRRKGPHLRASLGVARQRGMEHCDKAVSTR